MSPRRIVALLVLALDAYFVFRVAPGMGMLGPVFQLIGVLVGVGALGVLVFNLPLARPHRVGRQDRRSKERHGENTLLQRAAGLVGALLLVVAPLAIAAHGVYAGALPSFLRPRGPAISFSQTPGLFVGHLLAYTAWAGTFLFLMLRARRAQSKSHRSIDLPSGDRKR